jgi:hypothetical protein
MIKLKAARVMAGKQSSDRILTANFFHPPTNNPLRKPNQAESNSASSHKPATKGYTNRWNRLKISDWSARKTPAIKTAWSSATRLPVSLEDPTFCKPSRERDITSIVRKGREISIEERSFR